MKDQTVLLALDTSHMMGSVALSRGGGILCEILFDASDTHSATLMPAVNNCLGTARLSIADVDLFAVVTGPGSFTGLRIGLATIKGFAAAGKRPVVTADSLELLASAIPFAPDPVLVLVDARRGEVYSGLYDTSSGEAVELAGPSAISPSQTAGFLSGAGVKGPVIACGTGMEKYRDQLAGILAEGSRFADRRLSIPSAAVLARIASSREPEGYEHFASLEPLYIRPPDAKLPGGTRLCDGGGR